MAIAPTGAIYKSLIFDGEDSRDYGVYITGEAVYNAPARDVEMVSIPGRNGAFALDKGRFENIEVTYPAGIFADNEADFARAVSDFRNYLCSRKGYCRLTDGYNPDEYRMAIYKSGLEVTPAQLKAGEFNITFDCKPQRWLTSGEEAVTIGEYVEVAGTDNEPYLFRASPQFSDEYDTEIDKIVGGTVAWNQYIKSDFSSGVDGWQGESGSFMSFSASNGILTATYGGGATATYQMGVKPSPAVVPFVKDHKVLVTVDINVSRSGGYALRNSDAFGSGNLTILTSGDAADTWHRKTKIVNVLNNSNYYAYFLPTGSASNYSDGDTFKFKNHMIIDLTQMFGSTIADYIYSLETANAGAGVAWFKKLFNKPYYAYNAGELKSVSGLVSHDMTGFNQWDEEWEVGTIDPSSGQNATSTAYSRTKNYIKVLPNTNYYLKNVPTPLYLRKYGANKEYLGYVQQNGNSVWTIPADTYYIRFVWGGTTYNNDICINLAWDNSRNGEYEPYVKHSYPLDSDLTLRGIPKLDADNKLYYDGDTYESDGTVTRKYGIVDMGSLTWTLTAASNIFRTDGITAKANGIGNIVSPIYSLSSQSSYSAIEDKHIRGEASSSRIFVHDSAYSDAASFKTAMNGVYLVYELATPTTETADPYTNPQIVDAYGTEEYVSTSIVPVGHDTQYGENPNVLVNPTLFESSPLLEVEGYGNIEFNGYEIELGSNEIGEILIADATSGQTTVTFDTSRLLSGDDINAAASAPYLVGAYVTISGAEGYYVDAPYQKTTTNFIYGSVSRSSGYFDYGVPETPWDHGAGVSSHMIYNGNGEYINKQAFFNFRFILAYDGADTLNISYELRDQVNMEYITVDSVTFLTAPIYGESSKTIERAYIDCELGEAYCIDGGSIISLNQRVDLGSDLPKLASGANEITYDNTITSLKVHPRWWKV